MEATKRSTLMSAAALGASAVAAVLAVVALTRKPVVSAPVPAPATRGADAKELAALAEANRALATQMARLHGRLDRVESQAGTKAAATTDAEAMRDIAKRVVLEALLQNRGKAKLAVRDVPKVVADAVNEMVPGLVLTKAEMREDEDDGRDYYRLEGRLDGREYDLRIGTGGELIEAEMPPDMAPEAVAAAVTKAIPGAQIHDLEKKWRDERQVFDVDARLDGDGYDLRIAADGTLIEGELPVSAAPAPAIAAARKAMEGIEPTELKLEDDDGQFVYEFEWRIGRDKYEIDITEDGRVLDGKMPTARLPDIVRAAALKVSPRMRLDRTARWKIKDDQRVYKIEGRSQGNDIEIRLTANGDVLEVEGLGDENIDEDEAKGEDDQVDGAPEAEVGQAAVF